MKALADRKTFTSDEERALKELTNSLKELFGERLVKLTLFGSRARGDYDKESDIDIAIIVRGLTRGLKDQILNMVADIEFKHIVALFTLVLSEEDFELLKKRERRIALDIEEEGVPL